MPSPNTEQESRRERRQSARLALRLGGLVLAGMAVAGPTVGAPLVAFEMPAPVPAVASVGNSLPGAQFASLQRSEQPAGGGTQRSTLPEGAHLVEDIYNHPDLPETPPEAQDATEGDKEYGAYDRQGNADATATPTNNGLSSGFVVNPAELQLIAPK